MPTEADYRELIDGKWPDSFARSAQERLMHKYSAALLEQIIAIHATMKETGETMLLLGETMKAMRDDIAGLREDLLKARQQPELAQVPPREADEGFVLRDGKGDTPGRRRRP